MMLHAVLTLKISRFEDLVTDLEQSRVTIEREREELNEYKAQIAQLKSELTKEN